MILAAGFFRVSWCAFPSSIFDGVNCAPSMILSDSIFLFLRRGGSSFGFIAISAGCYLRDLRFTCSLLMVGGGNFVVAHGRFDFPSSFFFALYVHSFLFFGPFALFLYR